MGGEMEEELAEDDQEEAAPEQSAGPTHVCIVDGCQADLSGMKPYFRRSKICPPHQAAATVILNGSECRFCQQCTRCHSVEEFDGSKRYFPGNPTQNVRVGSIVSLDNNRSSNAMEEVLLSVPW
eukprot:gene4739-4989_t